MPSWIQCPKTNKLVPKEEYHRETESGFMILPGIEPFRSPIDGSLIGDRAQLREHNRRHGVTNIRDYGDDWFKRKKKEREESLTTTRARKERINDIMKALHQHEER